jgi:hypothetical protein
MKISSAMYSSRRQFIAELPGKIGYTITMMAITSSVVSAGPAPEEEFVSTQQAKKELGVALVGLGKYSTEQLAPALQETSRCKLKGIVTGTPEKAQEWKRKYNLSEKNIYNYENFDTIKDNPDIDVVYVVLPNSMHAEYTIRAAKAGKHVICEKPMAV